MQMQLWSHCESGRQKILFDHLRYKVENKKKTYTQTNTMKKILAAATASLIALASFSADLTLAWINGANPVGTQTVIQWGTASGVYTNSLVVGYGVTNVTVTNLVAGTRYWFAAKHLDPADGDTSVNSNEVAAKTKLNPPKNLNAQ